MFQTDTSREDLDEWRTMYHFTRTLRNSETTIFIFDKLNMLFLSLVFKKFSSNKKLKSRFSFKNSRKIFQSSCL